MHWIDWLIALCPLLLVAAIGLYTQRFIKGVSDFLSAGRVAGRYVVAVASGEAGMGLISLVAMFELYYNSGLAYSFWGAIGAPLGMIFLLTGYCTYRYRESRAMTMGQFFEMRYSRKFRIFAGTLQSISGVLNYAIFPAVGARFLVYFCDLPLITSLWGWEVPTFMLVMAIFLSVAVFVATIGGQITIMTTDCVQGILSYPMYAIVVIFLLTKFSWFNDIVPPLLNRPEGKSFLNPFDIHHLRDFNLFYVAVGIFGSIFNRMAWSGTQGYNSAAKNAHEQKMGGVLGMWRMGFSTMMYILLAVCAFAYLNGGGFSKEATQCRNELAVKTMSDVTMDIDCGTVRGDFEKYVATGEKSPELIGYIALADQKDAARKAEIHASKVRWGLLKDEPVGAPEIQQPTPSILDLEEVKTVGAKALQGYGEATGEPVSSQTFTTVFGQMRVPMALKSMLPIGVAGIFCALCIFLLISTDTTYLHSWGGIIVQDVILPIRGKPFTPRQHLMLLRILIAVVALFAFIFSAFFSQIDFIIMFFAITGMIWLGGAGPCIVGGLYWKRGTTAGAFTALGLGSTLAVTGIIAQKSWETGIYPFLESRELVGTVAVWLQKLSAPFNPYIVWEMSPTKFPINSMEMYFSAMVLAILGYIIVSLLSRKEPHNMDRLLHRGEYHREGLVVERGNMTIRKAINKLIGINSEYTRSDRILARAVFCYSFLWGFGSFVTIVIWNKISPWPKEWWGTWYFITTVCVAGTIAAISTVWFTIGGTRDLLSMFHALKAKETNILDDGRVIGHVSADDVAMVEEVEHVTIEEAHIEEHELEDALEKEGDIEDLDELKQQLDEE
ncbi:MAG: sodium:panthothenate symporter [Kiritimatiellae bacterium]|nr:sodium:panthothenate symporter [Kiritimatiellia bacterium]